MQKLLETPKELAERVGIPVSNVRYLIREDMLDHIYTAPDAAAAARIADIRCQRSILTSAEVWSAGQSGLSIKAAKSPLLDW